MPSVVTDERQCRICLEGPDTELGRLIRPCLCKGSISYVHVKCLQRWRNNSVSSSAFYACPQCHYKYAFVRTRALGLASNHLFVGTLSVFLFMCIAYAASFVATFFTNVVDDSETERGFYYSSFFISPFEIFKDLLRIIFRTLRYQVSTDETSRGDFMDSMHFRARSSTSTMNRFLMRLLLGIPVIGVASFVQLVWSASMLGPLHFFTRRGITNSSRRERSRDIAAIFLLIAVIGGVIRALWNVYRLTKKLARWVLLRAEDVILEVN